MIIAPDDFLAPEEEYTETFTPARMKRARREAWAKLAQEIRTGWYNKLYVLSGAPASGKSTWARENDAEDVLIFDACHVSKQSKQRVADIARENGFDGEFILVVMHTPLKTCIERNRARKGKTVPEGVLRDIYRNIGSPEDLVKPFLKTYHVPGGEL